MWVRYGVKYWVTPTPPDLLRAWADDSKTTDQALRLPEPNHFIPNDFSLVSERSADNSPASSASHSVDNNDTTAFSEMHSSSSSSSNSQGAGGWGGGIVESGDGGPGVVRSKEALASSSWMVSDSAVEGARQGEEIIKFTDIPSLACSARSSFGCAKGICGSWLMCAELDVCVCVYVTRHMMCFVLCTLCFVCTISVF